MQKEVDRLKEKKYKMILYAIGARKLAWVAMLFPDTGQLNSKLIKWDKDGYYIL